MSNFVLTTSESLVRVDTSVCWKNPAYTHANTVAVRTGNNRTNIMKFTDGQNGMIKADDKSYNLYLFVRFC